MVTGDGDALSIGGNHLIHALRRNVNLKILLFNNRIYGLTKGQYSPTSELGKITKSTPAGSADSPFNPISLALGAEATFVARTIDSDRKHLQSVLRAAAEHQGSAFVEIYQNCNIFNDGAFDLLKDPATRDDHLIRLEHGQPITFGKDGQFCGGAPAGRLRPGGARRPRRSRRGDRRARRDRGRAGVRVRAVPAARRSTCATRRSACSARVDRPDLRRAWSQTRSTAAKAKVDGTPEEELGALLNSRRHLDDPLSRPRSPAAKIAATDLAARRVDCARQLMIAGGRLRRRSNPAGGQDVGSESRWWASVSTREADQRVRQVRVLHVARAYRRLGQRHRRRPRRRRRRTRRRPCVLRTRGLLPPSQYGPNAPG